MRLTFLGTGTSFGVPQIGCRCPVCISDNPRDQRLRTAVVLEQDGRRLLIDTPPELRLGLVRAGIGAVDAVLFTHDHADHTHGMDDLRALSGGQRGTLPLYAPADTLERLRVKFDYIFDPSLRPLPGSAKPAVTATALAPWSITHIAGFDVLAIPFQHGPTQVFGFRVGPVAYITDAGTMPDEAVRALRGVTVLVLNGLFYRPHPSHLSIPEAVEAARAIGAGMTWLTHLTHETAHADLARDLPPTVQPAWDGLVVEA